MELNKTQLQEFNNKDYKYFVCNNNIGFEIESGWEYKEDAKEHQEEIISISLGVSLEVQKQTFRLRITQR